MLGNNSDERKRKMSRENAKTSLQNDTFIYVKKLKNIKKQIFPHILLLCCYPINKNPCNLL